ncbi:hypothetical protein SS50377_23918 [Spironucleus salmonicida]|uniref:Uncharacterized protein n=1 Tax=Spironucleus salmonicida TaxID=348837 RepID=V6LVP3_9EUKA|nr:hypothetical protein SS50377_23918 [Spironucleus salmonicida]|eukprot:EST48313.1 Hypothetical protein SS50377_11514 [Spironucleus salmonicida]
MINYNQILERNFYTYLEQENALKNMKNYQKSLINSCRPKKFSAPSISDIFGISDRPKPVYAKPAKPIKYPKYKPVKLSKTMKNVTLYPYQHIKVVPKIDDQEVFLDAVVSQFLGENCQVEPMKRGQKCFVEVQFAHE